MKEPIISVSGLRGIIGESLTPEVAARFACAFSTGLPPGPILLSRDGRATGWILADAIRSYLCALGRDVLDARVAATPTTGVLVRTHRAAGGIQISASHNPAEYNGLKLFSSAGQVVTAEEGQPVIQRYRQGDFPWARYDRLGTANDVDDTTTAHAELVLATIDVERIRNRQFRVLLDSNHGAGSILARRLLTILDCEFEILGGEADGRYSHPPEPTADNLQTVSQHVTQFRADIGFCQDPDADRLAVIDHQGRYLGEEYTLAMCLDHVLRQRKGPVVTNCATSRMTEDVAQQHGVPCFRSPVGEANVVALMQQKQAAFGGEGNGGPIDPRVGYVRDSFVGMALILDAMAARKQAVSQLADALPRYAIHKSKVTLDPEKIPAALETLERNFAEAQSSRMDGLRLDWKNQWLLVRASNTEPIVRVIAEAPTEKQARELCSRAADCLAKCPMSKSE